MKKNTYRWHHPRDEAHSGKKSKGNLLKNVKLFLLLFLFFFVISPPVVVTVFCLSHFIFVRKNEQKSIQYYSIYSSQCRCGVVIYGPSVFVGICRTAGLPRQIFSPDARTILMMMWYRRPECVWAQKILAKWFGKTTIANFWCACGGIEKGKNKHIHTHTHINKNTPYLPTHEAKSVKWTTTTKSKIKIHFIDTHAHIFIWSDY